MSVVGELACFPRTAADHLAAAAKHRLRKARGVEAAVLELERRTEGVADG